MLEASVRSIASVSILQNRGNQPVNNNQQPQPKLRSAVDSLKDVSEIYINTLERKTAIDVIPNEFEDLTRSNLRNSKHLTTNQNIPNEDISNNSNKSKLQTFVQQTNRFSQLEQPSFNTNNQSIDNISQTMYRQQQPIYENVDPSGSAFTQNRGSLNRGHANTLPPMSSSAQEYDDDFDDEDEEAESTTNVNSYGIGHLVKNTEPSKQLGKLNF